MVWCLDEKTGQTLWKLPVPARPKDRLPENAPAPDFDPRAVAKGLLRATRAGALATIDRNTTQIQSATVARGSTAPARTRT